MSPRVAGILAMVAALVLAIFGGTLFKTRWQQSSVPSLRTLQTQTGAVGRRNGTTWAGKSVADEFSAASPSV